MDISFESLKLIHAPKNDDAGFDLSVNEDVTLRAFCWQPVDTGVKVNIPVGHFGLVTSRSGLRFKHNIHGSQGIIDAGYNGNIKVLLRWEPNNYFVWLLCIVVTFLAVPIIGFILTVIFFAYFFLIGKRFKVGDRMAQMIIIPFENKTMNYVQDFNGSARGDNGFGSTGV